MASINQIVNKAHQLGISLEKDLNELNPLWYQWEKNAKNFSIPYLSSHATSFAFSETVGEEYDREEAWIEEAWL